MDTGTVLFHIKAFAAVRGLYQLSSVIAAIVPDRRWPGEPPIPKAYSPVHVTGPIDCLDSVTGFPVVTVEAITVEVGNRKAGVLGYEAQEMMDQVAQAGNHAYEPALIPNLKFPYRHSTASLASIIPAHGLWPAILDRPAGANMETGTGYSPFADCEHTGNSPPPCSEEGRSRLRCLAIVASASTPNSITVPQKRPRQVKFDIRAVESDECVEDDRSSHVANAGQVSTIIASIVPNNRWPRGPPSPKPNSPVHVMGPIDCIDANTKLPVVTVEELTLEVGNRKLAEIANLARLRKAYQEVRSRSMPPNFGDLLPHELAADVGYPYQSSSVSLASTPSLPNSWPIPLERPLGASHETGIEYPRFGTDTSYRHEKESSGENLPHKPL
ncbi:hypothetical protein M422DRAFT_265218 [Sphaerobolus stellatus SS14]|uniref:Uncharacterized protein n=1 Tax=Sphaerobolus stellatus (strain SS14) TaxID=990650 RepID=A0A0C9TRU7_SPHS4|nr:hypothetical protein M422DRAFT_265218 [Sphaerobolus stellatus SS14]